MIGLRSLISGTLRARPTLSRIQTPFKIQKRADSHHEGPPQPFDNMPFSIPNRFVATLVFALLFGSGFAAPYLLMWYMMAKRTL